jgi:chromosome partitioning protein
VKIVTILSLSGGQGKTTVCFLLGRYLSLQGARVLLIDTDPQNSLSMFSRAKFADDEPTLREVLLRKVGDAIVNAEDAIYETPWSRLFIIPSDEKLAEIQSWLANTGTSLTILRESLDSIRDTFDICLIDSPPQQSHFFLTSMGAADEILIPAEASVKGFNSFLRTYSVIQEYRERRARIGSIQGVIPFRRHYVGLNEESSSRESVAALEQAAADMGIEVMPSIIQSGSIRKAFQSGEMPSRFGKQDLDYPFEVIGQRLWNQAAAVTS